MVEFIGRGITYWDIAKAAAIPALLYFTGIWIMTHFEAKRVGLEGLTIYKYTLEGHGDIVKDYVEGRKHFNHKDLIWK